MPEEIQELLTLGKDPASLTFNDVQDLLIEDSRYLQARSFYQGDHFQGGDAWIGPRLDEDEEDSHDVLSEIEASLVTHDAVAEVAERKRDAMIGSSASWEVTVDRAVDDDHPVTEAEKRRIDEINSALVKWWDDKEALGVMQRATLDLQLGARGLMRLMVPVDQLATVDVDGQSVTGVPRGDMQSSLDRIWPVFVLADQARVLRDPFTMRKVGVYVYEVTDLETSKTLELAEVSYVTKDLKTVTKVVAMDKSSTDPAAKEVPYGTPSSMQLGGRLTIYEMITDKPLITEAILSNQKLLDMALTMLGVNVVLGGFLERIILNGQRPGEWTDPDTGETVGPGTPGAVFKPMPFKTGARTTQWLQGAVKGFDPTTRQPIIADPSVEWRDPVDVDTFTETASTAYENILHSAKQLHITMSGDAVASGESRKQARDDYEKSLKKDKSVLDAAGKWLLESVLWMAANFMGKPDFFKGLRVVFDTKVDAGPIAAIDRAAMREEVKDKLRSRENYMVSARITDDPEAMTQTIITEEQELIDAGVIPDPNILAEAQLLKAQGGSKDPNDPNPDSDVEKGTGRSKPRARRGKGTPKSGKKGVPA